MGKKKSGQSHRMLQRRRTNNLQVKDAANLGGMCAANLHSGSVPDHEETGMLMLSVCI